jgi:hypothetical protein
MQLSLHVSVVRVTTVVNIYGDATVVPLSDDFEHVIIHFDHLGSHVPLPSVLVPSQP